ncbi:flagellar biosynthetic protein FliQ [Sandaracinobacteroides saxicola]|uniref:Flagellar biosynthetic protein FliQ n=1 Tax=Sandaracinobacteroides saxicola TaxID=2759707 RepID=A0A7G5IK04_9SPHN|nr:flagellar biosynthetic protein FliQ [Sandaracinobacteroides saxicola]QMW23696.1 flagellar biosynthetic protein FliQ [Sandaracinobacteroides saxicola]
MTPDAVTDVLHRALLAGLGASWPLLATALAVGVVIGLVQALTQVQESTLTFVPKLLAVGGALALCASLMGQALGSFARHAMSLVAGG